MLVPPDPGKPLLLYLSVMDNAFECVLGQHDERGRREQVIYYLRTLGAENETYIVRLRMSIDMNIKEILVIGDSYLLVHLMQGEWTTKNVKILPYLHYIMELSRWFEMTLFKHVPGTQNEFVDALATLSLMIQHSDKSYIDPINVEINDQHAHYFHVDEEPNEKT